ncbi:helix-turn-helix domain-containing protein [Sphingomonas mucosissima]|uniref:Bacterial regulatory protein, luxR family n=1 Tax=Sphingomonas mucosissima TaxID=370959 RepID=A0A245ZIQ2_9SPHN|nr:DUF4019 domain-containing protein [Sphingomonas mucosissima]OWK29605.1 bacterial regulatory protein, luxR family [Sphingomonas mucosissima]
MTPGVEALTEKEKQTLRLLLAGHDAKSMARHFDLSVHTINERLRDARRKLAVSSSKEAARLLREAEGGTPQNIGDAALWAASPGHDQHHEPQSPPSPRRSRAVGWAIGGTAMISLAAALLAVTSPTTQPADQPAPAATAPLTESEGVKAAREWLELGDAANWRDSYAATTQSFRTANTLENWQSAAEKVRSPLGRVVSRTLISDMDTPAPPNGYRTVQFRTDFASKKGAIETIALNREGGTWKVAGIYVD